jgi:carboxypeptidase C (cathepsin A)
MWLSPFRRLAVALAVLCAAPATAQPADGLSVRCARSAVIGRETVGYTVTTGRLRVADKSGRAKANVFFVAYTVPADPPAARPLTFCFNGGPGAPAAYVHLLAFGPRRLAVADDGLSVPRPPALVDNAGSLLDSTDLVFLDPVGTGYSRADRDEDAKLFHGIDEDAHAVAEFVRGYAEKSGRRAAPVFLAGESYGAFRAAAVAKDLQDRGGVRPAGLVLVSPVLDYATTTFGGGNDLPYVLALPTYTATVLHHKRYAGDRAAVLAEAEAFARGPYAEALKKGRLLPPDERLAVARGLAWYSGLSIDTVLRSDLRVAPNAFRGELFRGSGEVLGRFDTRVKAAVGGQTDPSAALTTAPLASVLKTYFADDLGLRTDLPYLTLPAPDWNFGPSRGKATVVPRLRAALEADGGLRVFAACGYCDLATPFAAAKYSLATLGGPPDVQGRVSFGFYDGGHMMYTVREAHQKLKADVARFLTAPPVAPPPRERPSPR